MGDLTDIFNYLINYPLKETPYPDNYPDELRYDPYPGKDLVIGMCDEAIDNFLKVTNPATRQLACDYAKLFKGIRKRRLGLLHPVKTKPPPITMEAPRTNPTAILDLETWLKENPDHPDYPAKLKQLEALYNDPWIQSVYEALIY